MAAKKDVKTRVITMDQVFLAIGDHRRGVVERGRDRKLREDTVKVCNILLDSLAERLEHLSR